MPTEKIICQLVTAKSWYVVGQVVSERVARYQNFNSMTRGDQHQIFGVHFDFSSGLSRFTKEFGKKVCKTTAIRCFQCMCHDQVKDMVNISQGKRSNTNKIPASISDRVSASIPVAISIQLRQSPYNTHRMQYWVRLVHCSSSIACESCEFTFIP